MPIEESDTRFTGRQNAIGRVPGQTSRVTSLMTRPKAGSLLFGILALLASTVSRAQPGPVEAAFELKIFLEKVVRADHRVLNFRMLDEQDVGPVRRVVRYEARIEFPVGTNTEARDILGTQDTDLVEGDLEQLSSNKVVIDLRRDATFVNTSVGWAIQVGTTRYPLSR